MCRLHFTLSLANNTPFFLGALHVDLMPRRYIPIYTRIYKRDNALFLVVVVVVVFFIFLVIPARAVFQSFCARYSPLSDACV